MTRVLHVVAEYSRREAIGRTIAETATRLPGEHHLVAAVAHDGHDLFASTTSVGGSLSLFTVERADEIAALIEAVRPEVIHLHGGILVPFLGLGRPFRGRTLAYTVYAWPRLPRLAELRRSTWRELRLSNVLRPRVLLTSLLGPRAVRSALRRRGRATVLSPDPTVRRRLGDDSVALPSGASPDARRARPSGRAPVVLFAGRAESVRGIDTLLDAFPAVRSAVPDARLRLLLLPTAELPALLARIEVAGLGDVVEVVTDPVHDLADELAAAQVGVWPFKFDYTTSPPAMALAEAMAVGLPVVSTPVACVEAVAEDDVNAALVPVGDADALAAAIVDLLVDVRRWERLSEAGIATIADHHNWDSAVAVTGRVYLESLEQAA